MQLKLQSGKYVVAVSGGVDSVVLLDLLVKNKPSLNLVVAHFDHGIRADSASDKELVEKLAKKYNLSFYSAEGKLGANTSEETARDKRYQFLNSVVKQTKANRLITAHHQDDLIESAIINIIRGTGRRGLSSIINSKVNRPLLNYSKAEIKKYAIDNKLQWNEDSTNSNPKYLRNYIRLNVVPKLKGSDRDKILDLIQKQSQLNQAIDSDLKDIVSAKFKDNQLPRLWFASLDSHSANEVLAYWLRSNGLGSYDKKNIIRLTATIKSSHSGKKIDVFSGMFIEVGKDFLALKHLER